MVMAKRFGKVKDYNDWMRPAIVENSLELLEKEIPKYKDRIDFVHLSFTTDPFMQGYPEVGDLTLKIIERLNKDSIKCTVLTKGVYPKKIAKKDTYGHNNMYGITLVSLDEGFRKDFEPHSAKFKQRIKSLKHLSDKGLKTWVSMEPYPTPNLVAQDLTEILNELSFVDKIVFGKLNYNVRVKKSEDSDKFYAKCANEVVNFCKHNKIDYHIKYGTPK
jgi:DNA repair photolyase